MGKKALITGAGMGIGRGIALGLAKAGYDIAVHYNSSADTASEAAAEAGKYGVHAFAFHADLTCRSGIDSLFERVKSEFGSLDLFVNNAGVTKTAEFAELAESDFDLMCSLDLKGAYYCIAGAAELMPDGGSIIIISSNNAHMNTPRAAAYASVKAGLSHLARHAAVEFAHRHIRINTVSPGWTDTGSPRLAPKESTYYKIPLKRWVQPDEIASAVIYLSSPSAASITGAELVMDGGASLMTDRTEKYHL